MNIRFVVLLVAPYIIVFLQWNKRLRIARWNRLPKYRVAPDYCGRTAARAELLLM